MASQQQEYKRYFPITKGIFINESPNEYSEASKPLQPIKANLNKVKSLQDPYQSDRDWGRKSEQYEAVYQIRSELKRSLMDNDISGAWIKYYEICMNTGCIENLESKKPLFFFNGELPGAGLKAVWHVANTLLGVEFEWLASSLLPSKQNRALQDSYGLMSFYRDRWIMNEQYNGDLTDLKNHIYWKTRLGEKVDVYLCDAAGPVSDYNEQESEHLPIFTGAVLAALQTLKQGGRMIVKFYTMFEPLTLSIIAGIASVFDKTFLYKPIGSKRDNSEIYIVAFGYNKRNRFINALKDVLRNKQSSSHGIPLGTPRDTLDNIVNAQLHLAASQSYKLSLNIKSFETSNEEEVLAIAKDDYNRWMRDNPTMILEKKMLSYSNQSRRR